MRLLRDDKIRRVLSALLAAVMIIVCACAMTGCGHRDEKEVRVFCYGDYIDPAVVKSFQKETGIKVVLDTYDTVEEMYPVIKNRAGVYDVICPSDYMVERMINEGLLAEIDTESMPHYKNIGRRYLKIADESYDPGNRYSVPYQYGVAGIMYNKKKLGKDSVTSWNDLWRKKYKGKILMQDSLRDTMGISLKSLGFSLNSVKEKQLAAAARHLIAQKSLVYKYANDSARDLLIGNSADLGVVWNGEVLYSQKLNSDLAFVVPREGTEIFIDSWCIPRNAFHKDNARKFIDYMCRADVAYRNFEYLTYSTPNDAARRMMPGKLRNSEILFPSDKMLEKSESLRDVGPDGDELYSRYWKIFKSK